MAVMILMAFVRRHKDMTQAQLAKAVHMDQKMISMIERGIGLPTPEQRERIGKVLDLPPDRLLDDINNMIDLPKGSCDTVLVTNSD